MADMGRRGLPYGMEDDIASFAAMTEFISVANPFTKRESA
jgi:hypothetical protein